MKTYCGCIFDWKSSEMNMEFFYVFLTSLYLLYMFRVLFTHYQEHKLQSTAIGMRDC
jgi:hypothetical protein